ncbi:MAG: adenylate kinase [Opitutales bacterium]|nr:adenylate kinase [Opitutales bacterium]
MEKPNIILLGAPGSGKGTRAVVLSEVLGVPQIATGDLFRKNLKLMTEIGKVAKGYIDRGELVPDEVTAAMLRQRLEEPDAQNGFILDGFPRSVNQAKILDGLLAQKGAKINSVIYIKVDDEEIVKRLSGRMICSKCQAPYHKIDNKPKREGVCDKCGGELVVRDDDNPDTIRKRLKVFHETTFPLVELYPKSGILSEIKSEKSANGLKFDMAELSRRLGFIK